MNNCDVCTRWQQRIEAAAGDPRKVHLLTDLYQAHLESHRPRVLGISINADQCPKRDVVQWRDTKWVEVQW